VTLRVGDAHEQLPRELAGLATVGRSVDFVLVDGDHSAPGVRADISDLLASPAISRTVILAHDSLNEEVRAGLDAVPYGEYEKVRWIDLDFVRGGVARLPGLEGQCWGGFALILVDESGPAGDGDVRDWTWFPQTEIAWPRAQAIRARVGAS
jgi:hypothetical protein